MAQYWFDKLYCLARPGQAIANIDGNPSCFYATAENIIWYNPATGTQRHELALPGIDAIADADLVVRVRRMSAGKDIHTNTGIGIAFRALDGRNNCVASTSSQESTNGNFRIVVDGATLRDISYTLPAAIPSGYVSHSFRARLQGNSFSFGSAPDPLPALGDAKTINTSGAGAEAGKLGISMSSYQTTPHWEIEYIAVGTDGDEPPASKINNAVVSGNIYDDAGQPCSREVDLYLASTGQLVGHTVSSAGTGLYSIGTPFFGQEHIRIIKDDAGGINYNHLIARVIP